LNFLSISQFLHRHLLWFLITAYVIAVVVPAFGLQIRNVSFGEITIYQQKTNVSLLMIMLAILMFNAGLGLNFSHIKKYFEKICIAGRASCEHNHPNGLYFWRNGLDAALV
jgi:BASS family bile acid:Na+ symporter